MEGGVGKVMFSFQRNMKWEGSFPLAKSAEPKKAQGPTKSRMKT
jgi:hypothetical protein